MRLRKAQCQAPPDNPETGDTYEVSRERKKLRWPENRAPKRIQAAQQQCEYRRMYTREVDFHKPGIYGGSVRVWANAWTCFVARRLEVVVVAGLLWIYFVVCFECGGLSFFFLFHLLQTHTACCKYEPPCLIYLSTSTGMRTGCHYLISLSACLSVCMRNIRRYY